MIIKALIVKSLNVKPGEESGLGEFERFLATYFNRLTPLPNSNLTLLDLWSYSFGIDIFEVERPDFSKFVDKTLIEALSKCKSIGDEESCLIARSVSEDVSKNPYNWGNVYDSLFDDLIPLCSFGTSEFTLGKCSSFKKSMTKIYQKHLRP